MEALSAELVGRHSVFDPEAVLAVSFPLAALVIGADNAQAMGALMSAGFRPPANAMTLVRALFSPRSVSSKYRASIALAGLSLGHPVPQTRFADPETLRQLNDRFLTPGHEHQFVWGWSSLVYFVAAPVRRDYSFMATSTRVTVTADTSNTAAGGSVSRRTRPTSLPTPTALNPNRMTTGANELPMLPPAS